jgi:hypothetical protein
VAVNNTTGDVYVVDTGNRRVEEFAFNPTTKAYEYVGQFNGAAAPTGSFERPGAIAVDNSGNPLDPSNEDVYVADLRFGHDVIDQFTASGIYLGQLTEAAGVPFIELNAVAVDAVGNVWVSQQTGHIDEFSATGAFVKEFTAERRLFNGLAVDSSDNVYVGFEFEGLVGKFDPSGAQLASFSPGTQGLAINSTTNRLFSDHGTSIDEYGPFGEPSSSPQATFSVEGLERSRFIAVSSSTGTVFATEQESGRVAVFTEVVEPDVSTGEATGVQTEGSATLHGTVNPDGIEVTSCKFEYGESTSYESTAECVPSPGSGSSEVAVEADLTGQITPGKLYHYRLVAGNANGENAGEDRVFIAGARPVIAEEAISGVRSTEATVTASVDPGALPTTYRVEYGPTSGYGASTPVVNLGAGTEGTRVQVQLVGLTPSSVYHARLVASNEFATTHSADLTFTTSGLAAAAGLPDHRVYEAVSLPTDTDDGEVYVPGTGHELAGVHQTVETYPVRASADGDAVTYVVEPPPTGGSGSTGNGGGNQYLATRGAGSWLPTDIMAPKVQTLARVYEGFSSDLSLGFLEEFEQRLTPDAPANCGVLYSYDTSDSAYHAVFTSTETPGDCGEPRFAGVSADDKSALFESEARLTPEAVEGNATQGERTFNLYDSVAGHVHLVNVLPDGKPDVNATFGGVSTEHEGASPDGEEVLQRLSEVVSSDGSRVVWTDRNSGDLYVRESPADPAARTVLVAVGGEYMGASADGSRIFYTKGGDLFIYDVNTETARDLTSRGAVLGVLGNGADGAHVYFAAEGVLAANENTNGETPTAGQPNLYVGGTGETRFIATLSPEDNTMVGASPFNGEPFWGDWRGDLLKRTAEVTPDGQHVVFTSRRSLTGYDNNGGCTNEEREATGCPEIFTYEASSQKLSCASCNPTGAPPTAATTQVGLPVYPGGNGGAFLPTPTHGASGTYQIRTISDDGSRVFFDTAEPLAPQDTNNVQDVYEWERAGGGTCEDAKGCVYLLSGTVSGEEAYLVDASASGNDVFFTTRGKLVPQDRNEQVDLYDARVDGGFPETSVSCTGTGCQGVPPAPPSFATPSTVTFSGTGNFPAQLVKAKTAAQVRAEKLAKALKACRAIHAKHRRALCQARARKRYGAHHKATKAGVTRKPGTERRSK